MRRLTVKLSLYYPRPANHSQSERGIALVTVLFLVILMSILGLTMVVSVNSDMMINGYYGNARASYYAADSGMNIARQYLVNQLKADVNPHACLGWGSNASDSACKNVPLDQVGGATSALSTLKTSFASFASGQINSGNASQSWPSSFIIKDSANCTNSFGAAAGSPALTYNTVNGVSLVIKYVFTFNYTLCATGTATVTSSTSALQRSAVKESGSLIVSVSAQDIPPPTFAGYGAFINNYTPCSAPLIPGIFSGPTFTNSAWELMNSGAYIFTDPVGQVNSKIDYWVNGSCNQSTASSFPGINVNFQQGLQLGQAAVPLPKNSYSQAWAALDGQGCGESTGPSCTGSSTGSSPTNAQLNLYMKDINGNPYPAGGTSSGVYLPYSGSTYGAGTTSGSGGGIYIQGNASILLTPGTDGSGNLTQVYTITQGTKTTTITTDPGANTTTMVSGGTTTVLTGIPENLVSNPGTATPSTVLYVNGTITGLSGPGEGQAAIQSNAMVTVAGSGDIDITGDIRYTKEPVTVNTADTIVSATYDPTATNVLGVFTSAGNIVLKSPYSDKNLEVDGSLAAIGASTTDTPAGQCTSSTCGFLVNGSINTFTNVGGQIQSNIFAASMTTQNTYFDRRFTNWNNGSFSPPWFPSITNNGSYSPTTPTVSPSQQRTSWVWMAQQ
jgi:Tfp pilus assembly protein PilX